MHERSILIDARINALPGAHGLARSVMKLAAHLPARPGGMPLRVLVNGAREQLFPLAEVAEHADIVDTGIGLLAVHRSLELSRLIAGLGAAVLYVPYPMFAPLRCPCPLVVTIHDTTIENDVRFTGGWHRQAGLKLVTRNTLRRSAAVTAPTLASLADIRRHYPSAPSPAFVPNGVDAGPFARVSEGDVAAARDRYGLPERFILAVGAHRPHKNHSVLVRALAALPASVSLVIAGYFDPSFPDPLPSLITELGLASRVRLIPSVAEELLPAVYRASSAFAFPSLAEGYGLPVLEAMAAGVPVVASDIPAVAEVSSGAALLVPPSDTAAWSSALAGVLADPAAAARMRGAGSAVVAAATWERAGRALEGVLARVAAVSTAAVAG